MFAPAVTFYHFSNLTGSLQHHTVHHQSSSCNLSDGCTWCCRDTWLLRYFFQICPLWGGQGGHGPTAGQLEDTNKASAVTAQIFCPTFYTHRQQVALPLSSNPVKHKWTHGRRTVWHELSRLTPLTVCLAVMLQVVLRATLESMMTSFEFIWFPA